MDGLTRFPQTSLEVNLSSEEGNSMDTVVARLADIERELLIQRKANEAFVYGEEVEDNENVDLDDIPPKEAE